MGILAAIDGVKAETRRNRDGVPCDDRAVSEADFLDRVADRLAALRYVEAVALGGSRAQGTDRPDSDWDIGIYYRDTFDPRDLRDIGWPGEVSELGGWGGGVFNGGAWLDVEGIRVDVHYRDLAVVEHELAEARAGRVRIEPLLFHLAGIPTYLVVAELALNRTLRGSLPRPEYPAALRAAAPGVWWGNADPSGPRRPGSGGRARRVGRRGHARGHRDGGTGPVRGRGLVGALIDRISRRRSTVKIPEPT